MPLGFRVSETKFGRVRHKSLIIADFTDFADFREMGYKGLSEANVSFVATRLGTSRGVFSLCYTRSIISVCVEGEMRIYFV